MKARLNRTVKIKGRFHKGRPQDRVGMVFRTIFEGMTVMVAPSPLTPPELLPNEGERWEVELEREFVSYEPKAGVAKIHCYPLRELPEIGEDLPTSRPRPTRHIKIAGAQYPDLSAMAVKSVLSPAPKKGSGGRRHGRSEQDKALRNQMRGKSIPVDKTHGRKKQKFA